VDFIVDTAFSSPEDELLFFGVDVDESPLICNPNWTMEELLGVLFARKKKLVAPIIHLPESATMLDVLATAKIFASKGETRKNWKGPLEIPFGFSEFTVGKLKHRVTILKKKEA
jgi:hypothetical protein